MPRAELRQKRCAIYTRKSSEEGLDQEFNSLAAQREACEAYVRSQRHEGWISARTRYDDGGFSGGTIERPGLQGLLADIRAGRIDTVVVYKVDRLTDPTPVTVTKLRRQYLGDHDHRRLSPDRAGITRPRQRVERRTQITFAYLKRFTRPALRRLTAGGSEIRTLGPPRISSVVAPHAREAMRRDRACKLRCGGGSARFVFRGEPFHRPRLGYGLGGLRLAALLGGF